MKSGDVVCLNYSVGWILWECHLPVLAMGVTIFLNCSSVYYNHNGKNFWDIMAKYNVTLIHLVPSLVDKMEKLEIKPSPGTNMDCLKFVLMGGSTVKPQNCEYIRSKVKKDVYPIISYGATEILGIIPGFNVNMPIYAGEIQVPGLGLDVRCMDPEGKSVIGQRGELAICTPAPIFPIGLWRDENKIRLTNTYLTKFPGAWYQHDECWFNPNTDGFVVLGRSDDTLKQKGQRFGPDNIYSAIHSMEELQDYICVGQKRDKGDTRAILFVKMQKGYKMTSTMKSKIERNIHKELWEYCVPEVILEVPDIPYNLISKRLESVVREMVDSNTVPEVENIRNPDCLKHFLNIPEIVNYKHECS